MSKLSASRDAPSARMCKAVLRSGVQCPRTAVQKGRLSPYCSTHKNTELNAEVSELNVIVGTMSFDTDQAAKRLVVKESFVTTVVPLQNKRKRIEFEEQPLDQFITSCKRRLVDSDKVLALMTATEVPATCTIDLIEEPATSTTGTEQPTIVVDPVSALPSVAVPAIIDEPMPTPPAPEAPAPKAHRHFWPSLARIATSACIVATAVVLSSPSFGSSPLAIAPF